MALEYHVDRLEIEFGRHVAHRAIFVVKFLGLVGALAVAIDQMFEHLPMAHHMIAEIHRHEAGELQKARIDAAARPRIIGRHGRNHIFLEPGVRPSHRMVVHRGRRLARVDRPAHHRQRPGPAFMPVRRHDRRGSQARN